MARIRTIKPEFFTSEDVVSCSPLARLLFMGLWCEADRAGRFRWRPVTLKLRYLPVDECEIVALLTELTDRRMVVRYGRDLAYIPAFARHQSINPQERATVLPGPPEDVPEPSKPAIEVSEAADDEDGRRASDALRRVEHAHTTSSGEGKGKEGKGKEGKGREGKGASHAPHHDALPVPRQAWLDLVNGWNTAIRGRPALTAVDTAVTTPASQGAILRALRTCPDVAVWDRRFARVVASDHLTGANGKGFVADFWWVLEHVAELDAGRYDNREKAPDPRLRAQADQDAMWARAVGEAVPK